MSQTRKRGQGVRRVLGALSLAVAALLGMSPGVQAGQIYVLSANSSASTSPTNFGSVDTTTGVYTQIAANVGTGNIVRNLAWSPTLQQFLTTVKSGSASELRTIGTDGVLSASLGVVGLTIYGMGYQDSSSKLFAYDYDNDKYGSINPSNGAWTQLTASPGLSTSSPAGGRLAFHSGSLYISANASGGVFGTFGTTAGSTFSKIGSSNTDYQFLNLASDGTTLYGLYSDGFVDKQQLYTIDPATGALTAGPSITGAGLGKYIFGAAVVPAAAVPEPATLASAALGALVALRIARRRRAAGAPTA